MQKVCLDLENCYGIKALKADLDFSKKRANIIYAANGIMKTSLAESFIDLSKNQDSKDRVYENRKNKRTITDENGVAIKPEEILVIKPYDQDYQSSKISTLLANKKLKAEYDKIREAIDVHKDALIKALKPLSGMSKGIEETISEIFTKEKDKLLIALGRVEKEVMEEKQSTLSDISFTAIFNEKAQDFLKTKDFKDKLAEYTKIYDQLVSKSSFFRKGVFNHYQAEEVAKNLKAQGFFKADHSVYVNGKAEKKITTVEELEEIIRQEKATILNSPDLLKSFDEIDSKLKNQDLRELREYLLNHQSILPELANLELFKEKLWKSYLVKNKDLFKALMDEYNVGKKRINEILDLAAKEATEWQEVINIFNRRFSVPFIVSIDNQNSVILDRVEPIIKFEFKDESGELKAVERRGLLEVLSNGEKRALYILNIIFEIEARRAAGLKTLFVIDDIADSFDYKNKYAIVEYLNDILSQTDFFYQIILTHNYDFYRTVSGRLELGKTKFHAIKTKDSILLEKDEQYKSPFLIWKDNFNTNSEMLIASIPFVRNLAEYCGYGTSEQKLHSLLHIKPDTDSITTADLQAIFIDVLKDQDGLTLNNPTESVKKKIYTIADSICLETAANIALEKKIVLSIAIRLKTEEFLIMKINDPAFVTAIKGNQTAKLIREYKNKFKADPKEKENIKLVERVNLMTPENIHLNSFMYEPILDMSNEHLKQLCKDASALEAAKATP